MGMAQAKPNTICRSSEKLLGTVLIYVEKAVQYTMKYICIKYIAKLCFPQYFNAVKKCPVLFFNALAT